jgi:hypothetical protein
MSPATPARPERTPGHRPTPATLTGGHKEQKEESKTGILRDPGTFKRVQDQARSSQGLGNPNPLIAGGEPAQGDTS